MSWKLNAPRSVLTIIVVAQFFCTSLWFASNAVINELITQFNLPTSALGDLSSAVQFGFIIGTLLFAFFTIADRFLPSHVFFLCAVAGSLCNAGILWEGNSLTSLIAIRFCVGFFLAGIYPIGMKIAADHFSSGLGKSLGFLVGALALGTAFPHLVKAFEGLVPWREGVLVSSTLAFIGGLAMFLFIPAGPFRKASTGVDPRSFLGIFKEKAFRRAAFGYFGHMWELYAFWAFVPVILQYYMDKEEHINSNLAFYSFSIIAIGSISCIAAGYWSFRIGTQKAAFFLLLGSGICCLSAPWVLSISSFPFVYGFLLVWGFLVIADSPLFSTLIAQSAKSELKGTALTLVNSLGFALTIISIQLLQSALLPLPYILLLLAIGPLFGLLGLGYPKPKKY